MMIMAMNDNGDDHYDGSFAEPCPLASQFIKPPLFSVDSVSRTPTERIEQLD